ncbi:GNAT family N-acetyltransferase [Actinocorallia longicatena]
MEIRSIAGDELQGWLRTVATGFHASPDVEAEEADLLRPYYDLDRTLGAFDDGRCVATFRSFTHEVTAVGGAPVTSDAITAVTVLPTHRRRGLLTRMMDLDLRAAKDRGDPMASLVAAEHLIYSRYGFGPATWLTEFRVEVGRARTAPVLEFDGRVDLVDGAEVRKVGPAVHDRLRSRLAGVVSRDDRWWRMHTGDLVLPSSKPWKEPYHAVCRSAAGEVEGLVSYTSDGKWDGFQPDCTATVQELIAATPSAERALWHYLCSIDWITRIETGGRPSDDLLPLLLGDPRAARVVSHGDSVWLRPLDVPRLLEARSYATSASLVLDLHDRAGLAGGRFLLEATPDGATCTPTTRSADLAFDVSAFGPLYLGDESAVRLAALGRLTEETPGAAALADPLFRAARRPWCPDIF